MYIAHIREDGKEQSLKEHLTQTAERACTFAKSFSAGDLAFICGLLHDIGKYSTQFQERIRGKNIRVDHSTAGAKEAVNLSSPIGKLLAYCIAGHHAGLADGGSAADFGQESTLSARLKIEPKDYAHFTEEIDLSSLPSPKLPPIKPQKETGFTISFLVRMLYSCLVDADFLDTRDFMSTEKLEKLKYPSIEQLNKMLDDYLAGFTKSDTPINKKRSEILQNCNQKAGLSKGLFTLTVPTGGGKTLSSLSFALKHAIKNSMDRIIYVIPYTSIIEQNATVFKNVLGKENVLEHHSNFDFSKETEDETDHYLQNLKIAAENWDIPIIVTTNVQFFESLFSNRSSRCRKLHNMANSVIIFDEAQMLPTEYLRPCLCAIAELVKNYGSTAVLCSATQPALSNFLPKDITPTEICQNTQELYSFFRRTQVVKRGKVDNQTLAQELNGQTQTLCIVNTKKHAQDLYSLLTGEGVFHLSTLMCPAHRKEVIAEIKHRLKNNLPCKTISTQLIEAGVDVDFPIVYRAMAGIDSIVQSAGRCNREGRTKTGLVHVFEAEEDYRQPGTLSRPTAVALGIARRHDDIMSPEAIKSYFTELYEYEGDRGLDIKDIIGELNEAINELCINFKTAAEKFRLIEENTHPVIIPYDETAVKIIEKLKYAESYGSILRSLQSYTVNIYENDFKALFGAGKLELTANEIAVLRDKDATYGKTGLLIPRETGIGIYT